MAVRNFWVEAEIDGRKTKLSGGPARADGGMRVRFLMRDGPNKLEAYTIEARAEEGELTATVFDWKGRKLKTTTGHRQVTTWRK